MNKISEIIDKHDQELSGYGGFLSDFGYNIKRMMVEYAEWHSEQCIIQLFGGKFEFDHYKKTMKYTSADNTISLTTDLIDHASSTQ